MSSRNYYVYILASRSRVLYTGVTNDLERRLAQHRTNTRRGFSARYNADRLVWFDETDDVSAALTMEKEIKSWNRVRKVELIEANNPGWHDLSLGWGLPGRSFVSDSG
jgi:putative endonuclease